MKQGVLDIDAKPSHRREDFVVSGCNQLVWDWLEKWPNWPSHAAMIVGPNASGKTHLCQCWAESSGAEFLANSLSSELPGQPAIVDDADQWSSADGEKQLFHLLNHAKEEQSHLLLTASSHPSSWNIGLNDLRSRLLSLPIWELSPPDEGLLAAVLSKHFADQQVQVDPAVIHYIVNRTERSFSAIHQLAHSLNQFALAAKRPITNALVRQWLEESSAC